MGKIYQTSENAKNDFLRTRWFKTNYAKAKQTVLDVLKSYGLSTTDINDDYGEILVECQEFNLVVTIFEFRVNEVSIDVYIESHYTFDFGKTKKILQGFYNDVAKNIEFLGYSLHKEK